MDTKPKTETTQGSMPLAPIVQRIQVEVKNSKEYRLDGNPKIFYQADAELATPGERWSSLRVKVKGDSPIPTGMRYICLDTYDLKKGEGVAHVVLD